MATMTQSKKRHSLIAARKNKRLNQEQVAKILGVSQGNISRYESGEQIPTLPVAFKIAELYECDIKSLFHD